jgi:hypothetical protein
LEQEGGDASAILPSGRFVFFRKVAAGCLVQDMRTRPKKATRQGWLNDYLHHIQFRNLDYSSFSSWSAGRDLSPI